MKFLYSDDLIIACSTSQHAHAAIAVIRISGFSDLTIFQSLFSLNLGPIEPRKVYFTKLISNGQTVDEICLTFFKGPHSYNSENILELSVHGNTLNVDRILDLFIKTTKCRLAYPGEFTYRALKNKKLSISQVEGLDLFLNANSSYALDQGISLLNGNLQEAYQELFDLFLRHKSALELSIDFSDDVGEETAKKYFFESLTDFQKKFERLYKRVLPLEYNLISPEIVLAGLPNSGKSSFFNFLLSDDRAIVSSTAGTTRDFISETYVVEGVKYKLVDTAGIRNSSDEIESEGIRRTKKKVNSGFFSVLLINPLEMSADFAELIKYPFDAFYFTHSDCRDFDVAKDNLIKVYPKLGSIGAINIKELNSKWEDSFKTSVNNKYLQETACKPILLERHRGLIIQARGELQKYINTATYETDVAILSNELNTLGHCISELIGIISPDQILNSIFSNFCIGK